MTENGYQEPCPNCGIETILAGRRYDLPGFPYPHDCQVGMRVPNERDFCPLCSALTWGEPCSECRPAPKPRPVVRIQPVQAKDLPL